MKNLFTLLFAIFILTGYSQNILTIDEAIEIALKNSFNIRFADADVNIAMANNSRGNAGMMPEINLYGMDNIEAGFINQKYSDGEKKNYPFLASNAFNTGAELNWKIYDGGRMKLEKTKLEESETLSRINYKNQVLITIFNVTSAYYDVIRQKQQLESIDEIINFNKERVKIANAGFIAGSLPKTEVMQSQIDLNISLENAIHQEYIISLAKKTLNNSLGRNNDFIFEVLDTIIIEPLDLTLEKLTEKIDSNTEIKMLQNKLRIAELNLDQANKLNSPVLTLNGNLSISQLNNSAGSLTGSTSIGPQAGGRISYPLYTAGENKRKQSVAKIELMNVRTELTETIMLLKTALNSAYESYENQAKLLNIERENNILARENLMISLERLRLGQTNSLEIHQAQEYLIQSNTRYINFQYNMKIAESKVRQLLAEI